jgi:hypothetical protein
MEVLAGDWGREAASDAGQSGANIESQFATVLAVRGALNEHFSIGSAVLGLTASA